MILNWQWVLVASLLLVPAYAPTTGKCKRHEGDGKECHDYGCCYCELTGSCKPRVGSDAECKSNGTVLWHCPSSHGDNDLNSSDATIVMAVALGSISCIVMCLVGIAIYCQCRRSSSNESTKD